MKNIILLASIFFSCANIYYGINQCKITNPCKTEESLFCKEKCIMTSFCNVRETKLISFFKYDSLNRISTEYQVEEGDTLSEHKYIYNKFNYLSMIKSKYIKVNNTRFSTYEYDKFGRIIRTQEIPPHFSGTTERLEYYDDSLDCNKGPVSEEYRFLGKEGNIWQATNYYTNNRIDSTLRNLTKKQWGRINKIIFSRIAFFHG